MKNMKGWLSDIQDRMKMSNIPLIGVPRKVNWEDKEEVIFEAIVWRDKVIHLVEDDWGAHQRALQRF